jgi:hypothetical protein
MTNEPDEDLIEATIRRVAEAKVARLAGPEPPGDVDAEVPEPAPLPAVAAAAATDDVDEDRIAETIRRVAEAKAARSEGPRADARVEPPPSARPKANSVTPAKQAPSVDVEKPDTGESWTEAVAGLRRELDDVRGELEALAARFEASLARSTPVQTVNPDGAQSSSDDGWDDTPDLPRIPLGERPRPAIVRDAQPEEAAAQAPPQPETVIDTRPLPKPLPPLHAEPKRGLDLLPRTYRITVEDKRRGVDLVPLHRALLGMDGVRDMSLLSYSNGVAIVAVDTVDELEPPMLEGAISRAMARGAKVEVHNDTTMVVKLSEE